MLSEKHWKLRLIAVILLAVIGIGSLVYSFMNFLGAEEGWTVIEGNVTQGMHLGDQFTFQYCLGTGEKSASAESKEITALYTDALIKAYQLFENIENDENHNIYYINRHPNEEIAVDEVLYRALETYVPSGDRGIYLGPVYEQYNNLFLCDEDWQTFEYDPRQNPELAGEFSEMARYMNDPDEIALELLEGNRLILHVSEDYLQYARENYIENFLDLGWMKNAFVVDYLADTMVENGYTRGCISSYDGFIRNMDGSGTEYSFSLYDRAGGRLLQAATVPYTGPKTLVYLRDFPMDVRDSQHYITLRDGSVRTSYLDPADGLCKASVSCMVSYSENQGCVELMLRMIPVYIADSFVPENIPADSFFCLGEEIYYNDPELVVNDLYENEIICYKKTCLFE